MRPKVRSKTRMVLGKCFYRFSRYFKWYFSGKQFAVERLNPLDFEYLIAEHNTPLYRQLPKVDMWLQQNKVVNLRLAIARLNGIVVKPGEVLSFWRLVGKPAKSKGYVDGMVLLNGNYKAGAGGGLCQLSNLIYWMTLHTPLDVTERWRHSYDVFPDVNRTQPFGSGATVSFNHIDLQITNRTDQDFVLHLYLTDSHLCGEWRSQQSLPFTYEVYEKDHQISHEHWGGYIRQNKLFRKVVSKTGEVLGDELVAENAALMMYQPFLTEKKES